jgi:hypothetical protein
VSNVRGVAPILKLAAAAVGQAKRRGSTMCSGTSRARATSPSPTWMFWISVAAHKHQLRYYSHVRLTTRPRHIQLVPTVAGVAFGAAARLDAHELQLYRLDGHRTFVYADLGTNKHYRETGAGSHSWAKQIILRTCWSFVTRRLNNNNRNVKIIKSMGEHTFPVRGLSSGQTVESISA